jgi:hypothetical protein
MTLVEKRVNLTTAAKVLGISRTKLWVMVRAGEIESSADPLDKRQRLIPLREIERLQEQRGTAADADSRVRTPRFVSDGSVSNPSAVSSDRIKDWVRETWRQ